MMPAEYQNIRLKLMKMLTQIEAARAKTRRRALFNSLNPLAPFRFHAVAAKCLSTETAFAVASKAMQTFGAYGLRGNTPSKKYSRTRGPG